MMDNAQQNTSDHESQSKNLAALPTSPQDLIAIFEEIGIGYTLYHHEPIFTVEEGLHLKASIPGVHCRNLFLRDKKKRMTLVVAANETEIDLKKLPDVLSGSGIELGRVSFGSGDRLWQHLGIRQGSVNPFCTINDTDKTVPLVLDAKMMEADIVNYHPMDNAQTVGLTPADLMKFLDHVGAEYKIVDLTAAAP